VRGGAAWPNGQATRVGARLSTAFSEQRREDLLEEIRPLLEQVIEVVAVDMKGGSGLSGP